MDKDLDVFEFRILTYLVSRSDSNNFCFPSYKTIEKDLKISRSKAIGAIKKLKELGYISVKNRMLCNDRQTSNGYIISVFENSEDCVSDKPTSIAEGLPADISETLPSVSDVPEQYTDNNIKYTFNNNQQIIDEVIENAELNNLHLPEDRNLFETAIRKMYSAKFITVNGEIIQQTDVRSVLQNMNYEITAQAWDALKYNNVANEIPYLMSVIYNLLTKRNKS